MKPGYRHTGFTVIKLIVTMSVAAICFAIAIPAFASLSSNAHISNASSPLVATLTSTRSEATRRNQDVHVYTRSPSSTTSRRKKTNRSSAHRCP